LAGAEKSRPHRIIPPILQLGSVSNDLGIQEIPSREFIPVRVWIDLL
jgi:hypothetical protein